MYYYLLDWNLKACSWTFTNINVQSINNEPYFIVGFAQYDIIFRKIYLEKDYICSLYQANFILLYVARYYDFQHNKSFKPQLKAKLKIMNIFVLYISSPNHLLFKDFC